MAVISGKIALPLEWLFNAALPLWWERGAGRLNGGSYEKIDADGTPSDRLITCHPATRRYMALLHPLAAAAGTLGARNLCLGYGGEPSRTGLFHLVQLDSRQ